MTRLVPGTPLARGAPAGWTTQRTAWLLFGPPAFMVGTRWLLQLADDRQNAAPALPLVPVSTAAGALDLLGPAALALALLLAAGLAVRRLGWQRLMPVMGLVWALLWLIGSGALLQRHVNRQGLLLQGMAAALAPAASAATRVRAQVVASRVKPPSLRSLGGTELVLRVDGLDIPHRLLVTDTGAPLLKPGDALALQFTPGRFSGLFVTGWQALPSGQP
jgi:hypothetical protein